MAQASGLPLVPSEKRNPLHTTTRGVGEMLLDALDRGYRRMIIGIGGSVTIDTLGVYDRLCGSNEVFWHWKNHAPETRERAGKAETYLCSANGVSENGEIVNIDGKCNRVAATLFGPKRCIFVCGVNKLRPDLQSAIERARNIAAPLNAKRLNKKTPCAVDGRCHNCKSPERICRAMVIHMGVPSGFESCEVVLIGEKLGY